MQGLSPASELSLQSKNFQSLYWCNQILLSRGFCHFYSKALIMEPSIQKLRSMVERGPYIESFRIPNLTQTKKGSSSIGFILYIFRRELL